MILVERATESSSDPWHLALIQLVLASQGCAVRLHGVRLSLILLVERLQRMYRIKRGLAV